MKIQMKRVSYLMKVENGWREECPDMGNWYFTKTSKFRSYRVTVDWHRNNITIVRRIRIA